jgi:hypothetical protein
LIIAVHHECCNKDGKGLIPSAIMTIVVHIHEGMEMALRNIVRVFGFVCAAVLAVSYMTHTDPLLTAGAAGGFVVWVVLSCVTEN